MSWENPPHFGGLSGVRPETLPDIGGLSGVLAETLPELGGLSGLWPLTLGQVSSCRTGRGLNLLRDLCHCHILQHYFSGLVVHGKLPQAAPLSASPTGRRAASLDMFRKGGRAEYVRRQ